MDTTRSKKMADEFLARRRPFKRKTQRYKTHYSVSADRVYPQLCPTREADWIDGWVADLIYTDSGYSEPDCINTTPKNNILGSGLWIVTQTMPNSYHEFVVVRDDGVVGHFTIELTETGDRTCDVDWTLVFTAINAQGNTVVDAMPDKDPGFEVIVAKGLEHFLTTGRRMVLPKPS